MLLAANLCFFDRSRSIYPRGHIGEQISNLDGNVDFIIEWSKGACDFAPVWILVLKALPSGLHEYRLAGLVIKKSANLKTFRFQKIREHQADELIVRVNIRIRI